MARVPGNADIVKDVLKKGKVTNQGRAKPAYASLLTSFLAEMRASQADIEVVLDVINTDSLERDLEIMLAIVEIAKYEGFNPREIMMSLLRLYNANKEKLIERPDRLEVFTAQYTTEQGEREFRFTSGESFTKDMEFLCVMFITRGAAFDKILKKSSKTMAKVMSMLKVKYNINTTKRNPGDTLDAKTITVPRIAASFPNLTIGAFFHGYGRCVFEIHNFFPGKSPPRVIFAPMLASALIKNDDAPLAALLAIAVKTDDVLHQTDAKTSLTRLKTYLDASYNSTALTPEIREHYCFHWGLVKDEEEEGVPKYISTITELRSEAKAMIRKMRPGDPDLESILNAV